MSQPPYSKAQRVFVIADNGSAHRGQRLLAFGRRYEQIASPFEWKFTRADLKRLLTRLDRPASLAA